MTQDVVAVHFDYTHSCGLDIGPFVRSHPCIYSLPDADCASWVTYVTLAAKY